MEQVKKVKINTPTIKLEQFLKWADISSSGGEAKNLIQDGLVRVNGEKQLQRGKQLKSGDLVAIDEIGIFMVVD